MKNKKIILHLCGGAMSGIFGAGIVTGLEKENFYKNIEAVYGVSAGTINGAYFLSRQSELGSSIYYENLIKDFILAPNIPFGSFQRYWNRYVKKIPREKIIDAVDINYLFKVIKNKKVLDIEKLKKQDIPFYVKVLNLNTGEVEYLEVKKDPLKVLKAAVSVLPYFFDHQTINGQKYIDAGAKEPIGIKYLLKRYPKHKVVVAINIPIKRGLEQHAHNFLEGLVAKPMSKTSPLYSFFMQREKTIREDIKLALKNKRVLLIYPPKNSPTTVWTNEPSKLLKTYEMGKLQVGKIKEFIVN